MCALLAVVAVDGSAPVAPEELDALVAAHAGLRGPADVRTLEAGDWGRVAVVGPGHLLVEDEEGWLAAVGAPRVRGGHRPRAVEDLDGQFAAAVFGRDAQRLELATDALGMEGLHVAEVPGRVLLSTSALTLARRLRRPLDELGVQLFLRTGVRFGPVTQWTGVRRLEPATSRVWDPGRARERRWWQPTVDEQVRGLGFAAAVDRCAEVLVAGLGAHATDAGRVSADLTGGYDSRLAAAALLAAGRPFSAATSGEEETVDVAIAREVARAGGVPWRQQRLPADWTLDVEALRHALAWGDGALEVLQLGETLERQRERAGSCDVLIQGGGGEHFGPYPWLQEFAAAGRSSRVDYDRLLRMRMLGPATWSPLADPGEPAVAAYTREVLAARAAPLAAQLNTTQLDLLYAYRSTGHFGAYRSASQAAVRAEVPFYDRDVFATAFSVSHRWRTAHRLHRALIERLAPSLAGIRTERGGPAQTMRLRNAARFAPYYLRLGRTAVRKVAGRPAPASELHPRLREAYLGGIGALREAGALDPARMLSAGLYDDGRLRELLRGTDAPGFNRWGLVGRVATVELGLREVAGTGD